jgi:hypothetical protein
MTTTSLAQDIIDSYIEAGAVFLRFDSSREPELLEPDSYDCTEWFCEQTYTLTDSPTRRLAIILRNLAPNVGAVRVTANEPGFGVIVKLYSEN